MATTKKKKAKPNKGSKIVRPKAKPSSRAQMIARVEMFFDKIAPHLVERLTKAEANCAHAEAQLAFLRDRLVSMLTRDQLDMARTCRTEPWLYAVELIQLRKEGALSPNPSKIHPLMELKQKQ